MRCHKHSCSYIRLSAERPHRRSQVRHHATAPAGTVATFSYTMQLFWDNCDARLPVSAPSPSRCGSMGNYESPPRKHLRTRGNDVHVCVILIANGMLGTPSPAYIVSRAQKNRSAKRRFLDSTHHFAERHPPSSGGRAHAAPSRHAPEHLIYLLPRARPKRPERTERSHRIIKTGQTSHATRQPVLPSDNTGCKPFAAAATKRPRAAGSSQLQHFPALPARLYLAQHQQRRRHGTHALNSTSQQHLAIAAKQHAGAARPESHCRAMPHHACMRRVRVARHALPQAAGTKASGYGRALCSPL